MTFPQRTGGCRGLAARGVAGIELVVAIDPGKVSNRVWSSTGEAGTVVPPLSLPILRSGLDEVHRLVTDHAGSSGPGLMQATGGLHQVWMRELSQRFPRSVRMLAPSETSTARAQLGSRRFKTDDRDCAALAYLARRGQGRPVPDQIQDALAAAVRHRRGLVSEHKVAQQRLHDQLHALCPGLAAPDGHGRALQVDSVIGQAVLDCAAAFAGRPPTLRSAHHSVPHRRAPLLGHRPGPGAATSGRRSTGAPRSPARGCRTPRRTMNPAWGLSQHCGPSIDRHRELRARDLRPIPARIALPATPAG
jgi:hypothetical protein